MHAVHTRWRWRLAVLPVAALALLSALSFTFPKAAQAAAEGLMVDYDGWTVGSHLLDTGEVVYCIEPGAGPPDGPQLGPFVVDTLRSYTINNFDGTGWNDWTSTSPVTGEPLRRINYVLSQYGQAATATDAVAVQFAIWILREQPGEAAYLAHHIAWVESHGGAAEIAAAYALVDEAYREAVPVPTITPEAPQLRLAGEHGSGEIVYSAGTTELVLHGALFEDGTDRLQLDGESGGTVRWVASLHDDGWTRTHEIGVSGRWAMSGLGWPAQVVAYPSEDPVRQTLSWAVGPLQELRESEFPVSILEIDSRFTPQLSTSVVQQLLDERGEAFADTVSLEVEADGAPWPSRTGENEEIEYLPLRVLGTVYGPFESEVDPQGEIPAEAPVAAEAELVALRGPGVYEVEAVSLPEESGRYYWVWTIEEEAQEAQLRASELLEPSYRFADDFGLQAEMHVVELPELAVTGGPSNASVLVLPAGTALGIGGVLLLRGFRRRRFGG